MAAALWRDVGVNDLLLKENNIKLDNIIQR